MKHQQPGYILFLTFSMLALCTAVVSAFMLQGLTHKKLTQVLLHQEQMQQFTTSTTALAQSFLALPAEDKKEEKSQGKQESLDASGKPSQAQGLEAKILEKILPVVNKTQTFMMKEMEKDFPVVINLTFFCESGKININGLYDLVNKKFYDEGVEGKDKKVFATWLFDRIAALTQKPSLLQPFIEHLKQRKTPFNDVMQLLAIKEFAGCFQDAVFYDQQTMQQKGDKKRAKLFLMDLFTVASESDTIQPWLLSESVCALLDIHQQSAQQEKLDKKEEKKFDISTFKQQADWKKDWDICVKPIYEIAYDKIPSQVYSMFAPQFSVTTFSIMASVTHQVDDDQQGQAVRIYAILKQKKLPDSSITYDVIKIYQV
jgi:hypothetical protein